MIINCYYTSLYSSACKEVDLGGGGGGGECGKEREVDKIKETLCKHTGFVRYE